MDLAPCTVLEVGEYVAAPYAGKLFADLGATVVKVEPPDGDVARRVGPLVGEGGDLDSSGFFGYLNTGKRSAVLPRDPAVAPGVLSDLVENHGVDLVLADADTLAAYGVAAGDLAAAHDPLSVVSVSGFGATGPWREYDAPDLVAWAESGHMNKTGYRDRAPTRPRVKSTEYWAGQVAAMTGVASLLFRALQGGTGRHVDVSKREVATSTMEHFVAGYSWSGEPTVRRGNGYPDQGDDVGGQRLFEAADGYVVTSTSPWESFCTGVVDRPDLVDDERFASREARDANRAELATVITEHTRDRSKWDLLDAAQAAGIASGVTATIPELAEFDHLHARDFWQDVPLADGTPVTMPGFPFRVDDARVEMDRPPSLGEHTGEVLGPLDVDLEALAATSRSARPDEGGDGRGRGGGDDAPERGDGPLPLDGVKVLDFTWVYAGPHASKFLAALGADVAKVESARKPDPVRDHRSDHEFESDATSSVTAYFNEHNQGKRDVRLDLTSERGNEIARAMLREADVVMENFAPGFMERVGLDEVSMRELNPGIVSLSMPGWGKEGPARSFRAYGYILQSMTGLDAISGHPDDPPTTAGFSWPDPTAGYMGAVAALLGLYNREISGEGTAIELPQFEMAVSFLHKPLVEFLAADRSPRKVGNRDEDGRYVQGAYACAGEDRWAVVAVETDAQWERLCGVMGRPDLADDERFSSQYARLSNHDAVDEAIEAWTRERTPEEVRERLQDHDVPAGIVANERDLVEFDPQLRAREYFTTHDHPVVGERTYQGVPFEIEGLDVRFRTRAPLFGEHTATVLAEWLEMTDAEIEAAGAADALY